jgi:DNA-binding transcriptional LysR family regulator
MNRYYDLVDLKVLLMVAEEGNLSRGAQRCNLAPSSVSLRLKGLEESLGTALLVREPRGVTLTPAGRILVEHAQKCFAQLDQMHVDLMPYARGIVGNVTLFANNNAMSFLPRDLAVFFARNPTTRVTLEERMSSDIVAAVAAGRATLGIVALESEHPELKYLPYRQDELVLLVPRNHPLARRKEIPFAGCLTEPFICLAQGAALHTYLVNRAVSLGAVLDVRVQVSGYRAIADLVAARAGIGVIPRSTVQPQDEESLAVVKLSDAWAIRDLRICLNPNQPLNPHCSDLVEVLMASSSRDTPKQP